MMTVCFCFQQALFLPSRSLNTHVSGFGLLITRTFIENTPYLQFFLSTAPIPISSSARKISRNLYDRAHSHTAPPIISSTDITHSTQLGLRRLIPARLPRVCYAIILFRCGKNVTKKRHGPSVPLFVSDAVFTGDISSG